MIDRMKTRGERLKARRLELKMTLKQVAQSVGISLPGVQNLERGDVMPSLEIGLAPAKCLRKPVQWILLVLNLILTAFLLLAQQKVVRIATGSQENLPTQNDSCHLLANGKPFMRSLSGTRFSTTISRVTSSWLTQLLRQFRVKMC